MSNYDVCSNNGNTIVHKDLTKKDAIHELKENSNTLLKEVKNKQRSVTAQTIVEVSRKNFEVTRDIYNDRLIELKDKKNPLSKLKFFLATKFKINLGDLRTIRKLHKKYDTVMGLARNDIDKELKECGFHHDITDHKKQTEFAEKLKVAAYTLKPNEAIVAIMPRTDAKQYLAYITVNKKYDQVEAREGMVRYLGRDDKRTQVLDKG